VDQSGVQDVALDECQPVRSQYRAQVLSGAGVEDDQARAEEAANRVSPGALSFGVNELACRALVALARERNEPPLTVARSLLGLRNESA
ncbi:hypothetical protein ABZ054_35390, partial [Streptomyces sp. NPDC006324]